MTNSGQGAGSAFSPSPRAGRRFPGEELGLEGRCRPRCRAGRGPLSSRLRAAGGGGGYVWDSRLARKKPH